MNTKSDAIRLLMLRIADEHRLPFEVKVHSATTHKAIAELEAGKGKRFSNVDDLMDGLIPVIDGVSSQINAKLEAPKSSFPPSRE
jgi:hypothetical protein